MSTTSYPQQPYSEAVHSCLWLPVWGQSILYLVFLFSCCLLLFPVLLSFPQDPIFSWYAQSLTASVLPFLPQAIVQAWFALGATRSSFWQSSVSVEPSSNTMFQMSQIFFLSAFFPVQPSHLCIVIGNTRMWILLALVSSLHLMIFPSSFSAAPPSFCLLLISWLQSPFKLMTEPR